MLESEILERMKPYVFYHTIQLTDQVRTEGWEIIRPTVEMIRRNLHTLDLRGKRVLDIGCRDGLFCFEAERMGAAEVIGIDNDPSVAAREFLIPFFRSQVKMHELNLYDLMPGTFGKFDVVIFPGVLYHLRYPFWALKLVRDVLKNNGVLVLETATLADDNQLPLLYCPVGAESPYEPTSCTFYNIKALRDTLYSLGLTVRRVDCLCNYHLAAELMSIKERLLSALEGPGKKPMVDRTTLIADMTPESMDPNVTKYWDGTHRLHSDCSPATVFRDFEPR
jgi:2-polyprenyl-3-methyl-5-hydroxy-6-metoxy-1,4-benzoquinol methylase